MNKTTAKFEYSYTAPTEEERKEIEDIRNFYGSAPKTETGIEALRRLNRKATLPPKIVTALLSIFGILLFGTGMTLVLEWELLVWGIAVSALGAVVLGIVYPVQRAFIKRNKRKYGEQIVTLSDALLNRNE